MKPELTQCPKFNRCSAALCPLDSGWQRRSMTREDSVCFYLAEASKEGAEARFKGVYDEPIYLQARSALPEMVASSNILKKRLERAARSGSRLDAIRRLTSLKTTQQDPTKPLVLEPEAA